MVLEGRDEGFSIMGTGVGLVGATAGTEIAAAGAAAEEPPPCGRAAAAALRVTTARALCAY